MFRRYLTMALNSGWPASAAPERAALVRQPGVDLAFIGPLRGFLAFATLTVSVLRVLAEPVKGEARCNLAYQE